MEKNIRITEDQKELFESPKAEIIVFGAEDVISVSPGTDGLIDDSDFGGDS